MRTARVVGTGEFRPEAAGRKYGAAAEDLIYAQTHEQIALEMLIV